MEAQVKLTSKARNAINPLFKMLTIFHRFGFWGMLHLCKVQLFLYSVRNADERLLKQGANKIAALQTNSIKASQASSNAYC